MDLFSEKKISKITTGVPGLDDLFYGGLRLPSCDENGNRDGLCIIIYGSKSVGKSHLALQIMRGVDSYFKDRGLTLTPRYRSLNYRESELRKKYIALEVAKSVINAQLPEDDLEGEQCRICTLFPDLRKQLASIVYSDNNICDGKKIRECTVCRLIRNELINYNFNTQSLHWTCGQVDDDDNLIASLDTDVIQCDAIFDPYKDLKHNEYTSIAYKLFQDYRKDIHNLKSGHKLGEGVVPVDDNGGFFNSCYVIDGFTAFDKDELERLPLTSLVLMLKKISAVSILVLDERAEHLHFYADVAIDMRRCQNIDPQYTYNQLQIVKCDLQQHVHGWHKYRKMRDLSVKIYPSMHSLLLRRFSADNAVMKLERKNLCYSQSLLDRFQCRFSKESPANGHAVNVAHQLLYEPRLEKGTIYLEDNDLLRVSLVSDCRDVFKTISSKSHERGNTFVFFLMGETEQKFRKSLAESVISDDKDLLQHIRYWESGFGCIWAEEFVSIIKEYIYRWKKYPDTHDDSENQRHLHIIINDLANIELYPLISKESLFIPAIINVCRNATALRGYDECVCRIDISITFVCSDKNKIYNQLLLLTKH